MAIYFGDIDASKIEIGATEAGNNGNKYKKVSYNNAQVKDVQLGENIHDLLRCPYGHESASMDTPNKFCIKLEVPVKLATFIKSIDETVKTSVNDSSLIHRSTLKSGLTDEIMKIKLQPDTQYFVTTKKDGNKFTPPEPAKMEDIVPGSMVLPIIKIQGGVYFINENYGTSICATKVLVVKGASDSGSVAAFSLGDFDME